MRERIAVVGGDRSFVHCNCVVDVIVLEEQVADVGERRRESRIGVERGLKRVQRIVAPVHRDERDATLVLQRRTLARRRRRVRELRETPLGLGELTVRDLGESGLVRRPGAPPEKSESSKKREHDRQMFTIDVLTLFPEVFAPFVGLSIVGRAVEAGIVDVRYHHLLDAVAGTERADDRPYGGGAGLVMRIEPVAQTIDTILATAPAGERRAIVVPNPAGATFHQADARRYAGLDRLIVVCGHYEGIDDRLRALYPIEEVSLGDFVLTGGEIPALAIMDATARLLDGAIAPESAAAESFGEDGSIDYPAYTRPPVFRGIAVPEVLLSGDHAKIAAWRREQSRARTAARKS